MITTDIYCIFLMLVLMLFLLLYRPAPKSISVPFIENNRLASLFKASGSSREASSSKHSKSLKGGRTFKGFYQLAWLSPAACMSMWVHQQGEEINRAWDGQGRKRKAVRYTINPYWLQHHGKLFTVGVCHATRLVLTPAVVGYIDWSGNVNFPAVCVGVRVFVCL